MRFLFIVQGEGRGHLMQAMAMQKILKRNGHEVVEILVGKSPFRSIPDFFIQKTDAPVIPFDSPNFLPAQNKKVRIFRSILYNLRNSHQFIHSINFIKNKVNNIQPDVVINFYDIVAGLTFGMFRFETKFVCVAHQYLFLHPDFQLPNRFHPETTSLLTFTHMTALNADKRLALSFHSYPEYPSLKLHTVPPLLREEVLNTSPVKGDYLLGYLLNPVYEDEIINWHKEHPETPLHFFWDKKGASETLEIDKTLTLHKINDIKFIDYMKSCKGYASTGGFESICEAMYLEKPVMMIPAHIEQSCNVADAERSGAGIGAESFDLSKLLQFIPQYKPNHAFSEWVKSAEMHFIHQLTHF